MMRLLVWIAVCLVVALLLHRRPMVLIIASLAVWTFVPAVASDQLTGAHGGSLGFHASSWLVLATLLAQLVTHPRDLGEAVARHFLTYIAIFLVLAVAVLATKSGSSGHGVVLATDQMAVPFVAFWLASAALARDPAGVLVLRNSIIGLAAVEAAYAICQFVTGNVILYGGFYVQRYWYTANFHRWMGTTDHPLVLSLLICAAIPLLTGIRKSWLQAGLLVTMLIGVVITQSRSGVLAAGIGTMYVLLASRIPTGRKILTFAGISLAGIYIATSSLSTGVVDRIANDSGSASARASAWQYFLDNWLHYLVSGGGINASYSLATDVGLDTSFESAFLMYSIDIGIVFAALYFGTQIAVIARGASSTTPGATLSALLVIGLCQTFSSLEVESLVGPLLWLVLALAAHPAYKPALEPVDQPDSAGHAAHPLGRASPNRRHIAAIT